MSPLEREPSKSATQNPVNAFFAIPKLPEIINRDRAAAKRPSAVADGL
jgi:hypothetical protein